MSSQQCEKALGFLEYISGKQGAMEARQCDSLGQGTDASRMLEEWTRGKHANPSENARAFLRKRIILCASWRATSYTSIFSEKDFVRGEKQALKFYEQCVQGTLSDHCDSDHEVSTSLAWLPIWRGKECMKHEMYLETTPMDREYKEALQLLPWLPSEAEGYTSLYKTMQELMMPLDKYFSGELFLKWTSWEPSRHALRRVSLLPTHEHPFENVHKKSPAELFRELPEDVKEYIEVCPACEGIDDPRDRFTRAVVWWNEYYKDLAERSNKTDQERSGDWYEQASLMDEFIRNKKPRIMEKFTGDESASTASVVEIPPSAERDEGS